MLKHDGSRKTVGNLAITPTKQCKFKEKDMNTQLVTTAYKKYL